jgi:hypothetical protein
MRIFNLSGGYYCKADDVFVYEELEKRIFEAIPLRKDSFAEFYTKRIFQAFFQYARDLKMEYLTYYGQEYENFTDYLFKKELLDWSYIEILDLSEGQTLLKLDLSLSSYNADSLIEYEENSIDIMNQTLKEIGL